MSMIFNTNSRPDNGLQQKLKENNTPLSRVPFPSVTEPYENYLELLASDRYNEVIENYEKYGNVNLTLNNMLALQLVMSRMMNSHYSIINIEYQHREELVNLAINLVTKSMGIPDGSFNFDVEIINHEDFETGDFKHNNIENNKPEVDIDETEQELINTEDIEKTKRRLINAIIQGSSKRGHYMYHMVKDEIEQITNNTDIIRLYGELMSINDTLYWQLSDDMMKMLSGANGDASVAGKESIDRNTTPPTIYVRAINFPVVVHELIKGIMEVFAVHGLPENYEDVSEEDTIESEIWDLRIGPSIWKKLRNLFPIEILMDEDKFEIQNYLLVDIFKLPAQEFLYFMREVFKESDYAKRTISEMISDINNRI